MRKWVFIDEHGNQTPMNGQGQFDDPEIEAVRVEMSADLDKRGIPPDENAECYIVRNLPPRIELAILALQALEQIQAIERHREAAQKASQN